MSQECETIRVKAEKVPGNEEGYIIINKEDFNPETQELFGVEKATEPVAGAPAAPWKK